MRRLLPLCLIALSPLVHAQAGRVFSVKEGSTLTFKVIHKLHTVEGVSRAVEGKARVLPDGGVQAVVRARVDSFDSGNGNRDAHMKESLDAARFPIVEVKAVARGAALQTAAYPAKVTVPIRAMVTLHGVQQAVDLQVETSWRDADHLEARGSFPVSLGAFKIERPSLMLVPVDDSAVIEFALILAADKS